MVVEEGVAAVEVRVKKGLSRDHVKKVIYYANTDQALKKFTSDYIRYKDLNRFKRYVKNAKPVYYSLIGKNDSLAGIALFRHKKLPQKRYLKNIKPQKYGISFAIRIYGKYRGKGLSFYFMNEVFKRHKKTLHFKGLKNNKFWIKVSYNNLPAISTYKKFGFIKLTKPDKSGKILMILK